MNERRQIRHERWPDYLGKVTAGNRGRLITADVIGPTDVFPEPQMNIPYMGAPLFALEYEPVREGEVIVREGEVIIVSVGENAVDYEQAVDAPVELTESLGADGGLYSLEILDKNGVCLKLSFFDWQ